MGLDRAKQSLAALADDVETALVTARVAAREYARGRRERGSKMATQAMRDFQDIRRRLEDAEARGGNIFALRLRFRLLRQVIETLTEEDRRAA